MKLIEGYRKIEVSIYDCKVVIFEKNKPYNTKPLTHF